MASERSGGARLRRFLVALAAVLFTTGSLEEDELLCEEAMAHLSECCPVIDAANVCGDPDGCNPTTTLSVAESECVMELACGPEATAVCEKIEAVQSGLGLEEEDDGTESSRREPVCP